MRLALLLALPLAVCGCRADVREVRIDLAQIARLVRAYGSVRAPALPPEAQTLSAARLNDLGVMLERRGMLQQAEQHYRLAVEREPSLARAWVNLGNALRQQGRFAQALQCYRQAMEQDAALFEAVNNFADLCADTGQGVDEALALLRAALEKRPTGEAAGRDTLGKLLMRAGKPREAAQAFHSAFDLADPRDRALAAEILRHLAQACRALGDERAARSAELRARALH